MAGTETRTYRPEDADALFADLRDIDRLEMSAMMGDATPDLFRAMAERSRMTRAALVEGRMVAIWGLSFPTVLSDVANPWMMATRAVDDDRRARRLVMMRSRPEFAAMRARARVLWNAVAEENAVAIRWLEWLGFDLLRHRTEAVRGVTFIPFIMDRRAEPFVSIQ